MCCHMFKKTVDAEATRTKENLGGVDIQIISVYSETKNKQKNRIVVSSLPLRNNDSRHDDDDVVSLRKI